MMTCSNHNKSNHNEANSNANGDANSSAIRHYPIAPIAIEAAIDNTLAEAVLASVAEYRNQLHGRRIWLACSGGRDSLALAALCLQLYRQGKLPFLPQLLHVDHNLQAHSSDWANHVAKWAQAQNMPCQILRAQVNGNDEQAARQARYKVMLSAINQDDVLLLAHHADDQAETVLMRLIQGAGVKGLSGMQAWRVQSQGTRHNVLWRPWLTVRRTAITAYTERLQLPYINDPTNDSGDNVRSGLRCEIMPALATYNPNVIENIARSAQLLSDAQAIVSAQAEQDLQQTAIHSLSYQPAQRVLNIDELQNLPIYRQRQLLHYWLSQDEPLPPSKQLIDEVISLSDRNDHDHQTQLQWQGRRQQYSIRRYRQQLYRLSTSFVEWLILPVAEQTQTLSAADFNPNSINLKLAEDDNYSWHLNIVSETLNHLINQQDHLTLKIAPLGRQQRLQTALAIRPQSGKKLTQTLGIPVWLRDSLIVVSTSYSDKPSSGNVSSDSTYVNNELLLFLVSPFACWVLGFDKSVANLSNDYEHLNRSVSSILQIHS